MRCVFALILLTACYSPQPAPGAPCPDNVCPTGLVCSQGTCELHASDGGVIDSPRLPDARIDAPPDAPPDAYVPPTPVMRQQVINYANVATTISATLPALPTSGNTLIMIGGGPTAPLTSVSGGGVATWQLAVKSTVESNVEIWYGITDGSSATVTLTLNNSTASMWLSVSEWSELTGALDGATGNDGATTPASAGPITTTTRDLLIFGVSQFTPSNIGSPSPGAWTALQPIDGTSVKQREWHRVEPTPGTYSASVSVSNSGWDAAITAFKIAP